MPKSDPYPPQQRTRLACRAADSVHEKVDDYPITTALVVFGLGLGVGAAIGCAAAEAQSRSGRAGNPVESFGHRVLDQLAGFPESVSHRLHR